MHTITGPLQGRIKCALFPTAPKEFHQNGLYHLKKIISFLFVQKTASVYKNTPGLTDCLNISPYRTN